jgi:tetratricopeptide (TPR) repeat protein
MRQLINLLMITSLFVMMTFGANLFAKKRAPVEPEKTTFEIATEVAQNAETAFQDEDYDAAIDMFQRADSLFNVALPASAPEDSISQKIFNIRMNIANIHLVKAEYLQSKKDYKTALASMLTAIQMYKELEPMSSPADSIAARMPDIYENTAFISKKAENYTTALEYYNKVIELKPDNIDVLLQIYDLYDENLNNPEKAISIFKEYAIAKNNFEASHSLGDKYNKRKDLPNAIYWYSKADSLKKDANVVLKLAMAYRDKSIARYEDSNKYFEQFIKMNPSMDELKKSYKLIGDNYRSLKQRNKANEYFEKYISLEYSEDIATLICQYYYDGKNYPKTQTWANTILQNNPNNVNALLFRGVARYNLKDMKGAKADFERIKDDPKLGSAAQQYLKAIK